VFIGGGYGVGLTVTDVQLPSAAPAGTAFPSLGEVLPVHLRSPEEKALELQRVQQVKAELAAYEVELVAAFAADRPAPLDRPTGRPPWTGSPVSRGPPPTRGTTPRRTGSVSSSPTSWP
jgi:hypothetical protein